MSATMRLVGAALRRGQRSTMAMMFVVVTLASTGLAASLAVTGSSAGRLDAAFSAASGPDVVVTATPSRVQAVIDALRDDPAVNTIAEPRAARTVDMVVDAGHRLEHLLSVADEQSLGAPVIRTGRSPAAADEIAIDAGVAADLDIAIGTRVSFANVEFVVVGTAYDFADCFHPSCDPARSWVSTSGVDRLGGPAVAVIDVALNDARLAPEVEQRLIDAVGATGVGVNTWIDTRGDLLTELQFFAGFLGVFGVFVLVASTVVIAAALTARTAARRRSIGLAKAVGCTPLQLTGAVVIEHVVVAVVAGAVGWAVAMLLVPQLRTGPLAIIGTDGPRADVGALLITLATVTTIVIVATIVPAVRAARSATVDALRGAARSRHRLSGVANRATDRLPITMVVGVRRWISRPIRSVAGVVALMLALTAGVVAISIDHSMDHLLAHPGLTGDPWDVAVTPSADDDRVAVEQRLDALPEVERWFSVIDARAAVEGERIHLRLLGGEPDAARYQIGAGRTVRAEHEAIVGYKVFDEHGWSIGQTIDLTIDGSTEQFDLVGWYRETEDGGNVIQVREPARLPSDVQRTYLLSAAPGVSTTQLAQAVAPLVGRIAINDTDAADLRPFKVAMAIMAVLIAAVTLAHLFATALATARMRARDDAALRAVGMTERAQSAATASGTVLSLSVAFAIGVPVAWLLQRAIGNAITAAIGAGPGVSPAPPIAAIVGLVGALTVLALLAEVVATRRAAHGTAAVVRVD